MFLNHSRHMYIIVSDVCVLDHELHYMNIFSCTWSSALLDLINLYKVSHQGVLMWVLGLFETDDLFQL